MDKIYMHGKNGLEFTAYIRDDEKFLRVTPIICNELQYSLFKVEITKDSAEVKTDYFNYTRLTKAEAKLLQKALIRAMYQDSELVGLIREALKYTFFAIDKKELSKRTVTEDNIMMILDTKIYKLFIEEV